VLAGTIKNLIFDLGGVILDLSVDHTLQEFANLSGIEKSKVKEIFHGSPGFELYEKGGMNDSQFRDFVRNTYQINEGDDAIDQCWNAMLRGIPVVKLELLKRLKRTHRVYLLSNTNGIHLHYINNVLMAEDTNSNNLDDYFHKAYYSHRMLMRKPDAEIFEKVLHDNNLGATETLFLDDNASNINAASALGIQTCFVTHPDLILEYFHA
jgi:FMN phosphatase YigB (HAD superfamily)